MPGSTLDADWNTLHRLRRFEGIFQRLEESADPELGLQKRLRREFPVDVVRAALTLQELRRRAAAKFTRAGQMWFDRKGLEQATAEPVSRHKARRFHGRVWDYCCGLGGDSLALAGRGEVIAVDSQPARCLQTLWNAEVYGIAAGVQPVCADVETLTDRSGLVHVDPDQRTRGGRSLRVEDAVPGPGVLTRLVREFSGGAIKLSPASNFAGHFPGAEFEIVSLHGEAKEATVWFGELADRGLWRATALPSGETLAGDPLEARAEPASLGRYLYDPDPAVVRAGLVDLLAQREGLGRLDDEEEYLTADRLVHTALARPFEVLAELPNQRRRIRDYFRGSNFGRVEIKCRHVPVKAEAMRRKLPLPGREPGVLVIARLAGRTRAVVCRRSG